MKVTSWNIEGRLSRFAEDGERGSPEHILNGIEQLNSDVVFLPEGFDGENPIEPQFIERLEELGYVVLDAPYEEVGERKYAAVKDPHLLLLSRLKIESFEVQRIGDSRNIIQVTLEDPETNRPIQILGVHLDDRSEPRRADQVNDLIPLITHASDYPLIVAGDFNAMHGESLAARVLRNPVVLSTIEHWPHARSRDILGRLSEMAIGETMGRLLSETELIDADSKMRPTTTPKMRGQEWMPSIRLAQIDHILLSPDLLVTNFTVARDGGADHRAISATIKS